MSIAPDETRCPFEEHLCLEVRSEVHRLRKQLAERRKAESATADERCCDAPRRFSGRFGEVLRAARCGWRWSDEHAAWIRMSDADEGVTLVELCPVGKLPGNAREHRCWWEGDRHGQDLLDACAAIRGIHPLHYTVFRVNDQGEAIP